MADERQRKFLTVLGWLIFAVLCSGAGYMVVQVFQEFLSEASSFKQFEEPIAEFPTIVICTPKYDHIYDDDYDIEFEIGIDFGMDIFFLLIYYLLFIYHTVYYLGVYNSFDEPEKVLPNAVEKIYTYYSGFCYKLQINYTLPKLDTGNFLTCKLSFNKSISYNDLPDLEFYITSEKNSKGIIFNQWMDGQEEKFYFGKVSFTQKKNIDHFKAIN